jgi:hypothetical protein
VARIDVYDSLLRGPVPPDAPTRSTRAHVDVILDDRARLARARRDRRVLSPALPAGEAAPSGLAMERQVPTQKRRKRHDPSRPRQGRDTGHDLCLPRNPIGVVASVTNSLARQAFGAA